MAGAARRAVFLDRDGVLLEDRGLIIDPAAMVVMAEAPEMLRRLGAAGLELVVVTNQAVVARGLVTEQEVDSAHRALGQRLEVLGAPPLAFYVCPHHPNADVPDYRVECDCRKPRPGLLIRAARELSLDLERSFMIGDRMTDVAAGARAGCRTVLVRTGAHEQPPIETPDELDPALRPDHSCDSLLAASDWIREEL